MEYIKIEFEELSLPFTIEENSRQLNLAKSQTRVKDPRQIRLLTQSPDNKFVPMEVKDEGDSFTLIFTIDPAMKTWQDLNKLHRYEKLRLLSNMATLKTVLNTRTTFFLHPDNVVFDDNLLPFVIYRGVRDLIPPFAMNEADFLKQLKCFSIALFSSKYNFDQLYNGALQSATQTQFQRRISEMTDLDELIEFLQESYRQEKQKTDEEMQMVSTRRLSVFKYLAIIMTVVVVLMSVPLVYFGFFNSPYQERLLDAHEAFIASEDGEVISALQDEEPEQLPQAAKYILAYSYISTEDLSKSNQASIMNNVSLKSDDDYLLYWIYNGRGDLETALDKAKYLDDPPLIIHGLIQQREKTKNDPDLSGSERDDELNDIQKELDEYREKYDLDEEDDDEEQQDGGESEYDTNNSTTDDETTDKAEQAEENNPENE